MSLEWTTISKVEPGDAIPFGNHDVPAEQGVLEMLGDTNTRWRTVDHTTQEGRIVVLTFTDGTTFEAGHAYRLWILR